MRSAVSSWADTVAEAFAAAVDDPEVEAILFRVDSGGGSAVASETIARAVRRAVEAGKPVIVSMGDTAASGGYWIAMSSTAIVAQPGTLTGSIGVVAGKMVFRDLERLDVRWGSVQRGDNADMWSPLEGYDAAGRARLQAFLDQVYEAFISGVARGATCRRRRCGPRPRAVSGRALRRMSAVWSTSSAGSCARSN